MSLLSSLSDIINRPRDCSIFEKALDALPDGVLLINAERKMVYANPAFMRLWAIPEDLLSARDDNRMLEYVMNQLVDPEEFRTEVERLHPTIEASQDEIFFKDGRIFSRRSLPFQENDSLSARIWIFTDITEARSASIDYLTQLPNRRAFAKQLPLFVTAEADGLLRSLAILDIDQFKQYNDLYGHARGDMVLSRLGEILNLHTAGTNDLAFRIGGEEFLMAIRTQQSAQACAFFERVRQSIRAMNIKHEGNPPYGVIAASIGYGSFFRATDEGVVLRKVDEALYEAKAKGRNIMTKAHI